MAASPAQRLQDVGLDALALVRCQLTGDTGGARVLLDNADQRMVAATLADWVAHLLRELYGDHTEDELAATLTEMTLGDDST